MTSSVLSTHPSRPPLGIGTPASSVSSSLALPPAQPGCSAHGEVLLAWTRTQPDQLRSSLWAAHGMVAPARHSAGYLGKACSLVSTLPPPRLFLGSAIAATAVVQRYLQQVQRVHLSPFLVPQNKLIALCHRPASQQLSNPQAQRICNRAQSSVTTLLLKSSPS